MNPDQQNTIRRAIIATSSYYGRQLSDDAVKMYAKDLVDLPFEQVVIAMQSYRKDPRNKTMFLPAHIREIIFPTAQSRDLAVNTSMRIRAAINKFGWCNQNEARLFIGPAGWRYVESWGGWQYLCENLGTNINETTFMAQCRDAVSSDINLDRIGFDTDQPVLEQRPVQQISGMMRKLIKSVDNPQEPA